jgi:type I restriction enzyme S subunit
VSFGEDIVELVRESQNQLHAAAPWWSRTSLGNVMQVINGFPFDSKHFGDANGYRLIRIRDVTSGDTGTFYSGEIPDGYWVNPGDIVVGMDGDFNLRVWAAEPGLLNQRVCKLIPDERVLDPSFLAYVLPGYLRLINENTPSVTVRHLSSRTLQQVPIPLPPLAEQRRIVARIEALFARTRRARADLERIAPLAKRYREQSRRKAFMPDVAPTTGERRIELPEYTPADRFEELPDLPSGWQWAEMGAIGAIAGGLTKNQQRAGLPFEMPYLRVANVYADELRLDAIETLRVTAAEKARVLLQAGDLLIVEGNGSLEQIGRVAVWDGSVPGCGHQNHLIRLRPKHGLPSRFLMHWLMSPFGRGVLEQIASSSSGLHTLSLSKVSRIPVPIPGIASASAIADQLDQMMASSDRAAKDAARALALLDCLEQSILTRAFRGELVPQDPNDEPAGVLLERTKAGDEAEGEKLTRKRRRQPNRAKENSMKDRPLPARDQLLKDSEKWPKTGLPFEAIAKRVFMPHDTLRDALFELLSGPSPALQQRFDSEGEAMVIQRVAA